MRWEAAPISSQRRGILFFWPMRASSWKHTSLHHVPDGIMIFLVIFVPCLCRTTASLHLSNDILYRHVSLLFVGKFHLSTQSRIAIM